LTASNTSPHGELFVSPLGRRLALALALLVCVHARAHAQDDGARRDQPATQPEQPKRPQLTAAPELLEGPPPVYPPDAEKEGLEADVTVRIWIDAQGQVTRAEVTAPMGHGFDEAAVAAAKQYKFKPAEFDGKPGAIVVETTIHFTITKQEVETTQPSTQPDQREAKGHETLRGVVKERGTRKKLPGVTIGLREVNHDVMTDADGAFTIGDLPPGTYHVIAVLAGYDHYEEAITIHGGEETDVKLYLRPKGGNPYETTIETDRDKLEVTRHTITRREMTTVPGTFGDPLRVLQNLPGMNRPPFGAGLLIIRGSSPNDSGVYVDGHQIPLLFHFLGGPSILNPEFLEDEALYPGGFPVRFGRAIGGIVEVNTRSSKTDGIHGAANINLLDSDVYLRAPITVKKKTWATFAVAGRRSYIDALLPFVLPQPKPGSTLVVVPVYWDYQARLDVNLPGPNKLSFMAFGSSDKLDLLDSGKEATYNLTSHVGFNRVRGTYETTIAPRMKYSLSASVGYDDVLLGAGPETSVEIKEDVVGVRERVYGSIGKRWKLDTGLELESRVAHFDLSAPLSSDVSPEGGVTSVNLPQYLAHRTVDEWSLGAWTELAYDAGHGVRIIPGARFDQYLLAGQPRTSFDPRLVVRWQVQKATALKAYTGLFHQAPQAEGFDAQFGNPNLQLEQAIQSGAGVERKLPWKSEVDAEAYYIDRSSISEFSDKVIKNPDGTYQPQYWSNDRIGYGVGLEVIVKHEVTRNFYGWLSYTLSRSMQKNEPDKPWEPTLFDQTHNLIAIASYHTDSGWEIGARFRLTSGRPTTPIKGGTYDADLDLYVPLYGQLRSSREPLFHELDLRAEKMWTFKTWRLSAFLDVINVYNAPNPEATQWDYRYQQSAPVRGIPILPTLGVKGEW
jgi:TonB family protein